VGATKFTHERGREANAIAIWLFDEPKPIKRLKKKRNSLFEKICISKHILEINLFPFRNEDIRMLSCISEVRMTIRT